MIVCPRCSKENQDHYKFCLGCGAELPRNAAHQPKAFTAPTPPAGMPQGAPPSPSQQQRPYIAEAAPDAPTQMAPAPDVRAEPPAAAAAEGPLSCPKCSTSVPPSFKFCGSCGHPMGQGASPPKAPSAAEQPAASAGGAPSARGNLVLIRPDGSEGESIPLGESTPVGRDVGGVFASDLYLSPEHARFVFESDALFVEDGDSLNGVYVRVDRDVPTELVDGAIFRIGQELIRFSEIVADEDQEDGVELMGSPNPGYLGRLSLVIGRTTTGNSFPVPARGLHLGRERGDLVFPEDGYVSGLHARVYGEQGRVFVVDVGSSNGTFIRVSGRRPIRSGDLILMGQQLFRAEY